MNKSISLLITLWMLFLWSDAESCSTLCLRAGERILFGKNYDWNVEDGLLVVNKRGVERQSDTKPNGKATSARWTSKYGNVTFNQYGRNFPSGGINETGLVIELMWADGSRYPRHDSRASVGCLEWIQYQLDTSRTVGDVIASDKKIRIESEIPLHYLVADASGQVATIEFVDGKLVVHTGKNLPVAALTNDLYSEALEYLNRTNWIPSDAGSRARFIRAAHHVKNFKSGDPVEYTFQSLQDLSSAITQWSIVYEIDSKKIHFRTRSNAKVRTLDLTTLDFACGKPVLVLDLKAGLNGDIRSNLQNYSREINLKLITSSFAQTDFLARTRTPELQRIAALPDIGACAQ